MFVTVDKCFKHISQATSIRLEHSFSNAEKSFVDHFKIADYLFKVLVMIFSAM